jgi:hypothetical protein
MLLSFAGLDDLHANMACQVVTYQKLLSQFAVDMREEHLLGPVLENAGVKLAGWRTIADCVLWATGAPQVPNVGSLVDNIWWENITSHISTEHDADG